MKNIVIIGGGYAGAILSKYLDIHLSNNKEYRVILVEKKEYLYHIIAAPRAAVEEWNVQITFSHLFKHKRNQVVQASVLSLDTEARTVHIDSYFEGHTEIPFSFCVIATGIQYPEPSKLYATSTQQGAARLEQVRKSVKDCTSVLIVGGGPAGIELAGEVRDKYPDKKVTLVHSHDLLLQDVFSDKDRQRVQKKCTDYGIHVVLGERVILPPDRTSDVFVPEGGVLKTVAGTELHADLVMVQYGGRPDTAWLAEDTNAAMLSTKASGFIKVKPTLQVDAPGHDTIYALGDVADVGKVKVGHAIKGQHKVVGHNIVRATQGLPPNKEYRPGMLRMVISLGKHRGLMILPFGTFGDWLSFKSKDQMTKKFWGMMNATPPAKIKDDSVRGEKHL